MLKSGVKAPHSKGRSARKKFIPQSAIGNLQ